MATTYPTGLTTYTNPSPSDQVAVAVGGRTHSQFHSDNNDDIESLQAKVGADGSAVTTSHDYKLSEVTGSDKAVGKTATQTLTNKTLTAPTIAASTMTGIQDATGATLNVTDSTFSIKDNSDPTKIVQFQASGLTTATTRTKTFQDVSGTIYETGGQDVSIADGGTGASTQTAAFNALSPLTTKGDMIMHDGTNNIRVPIGTDGNVWTADSGQASGGRWGAPSASNRIASTISSQMAFSSGGYTVSIPGGTLGTTGAIKFILDVSSYQLNSITGDTFTVAATYGGSSVGSVMANIISSNVSGVSTCTIEGYIYSNGTTGTQHSKLVMAYMDASTASGKTLTKSDYTTSSVDSTANQNLVITLSRTNNGDITTEGIYVVQL